MPDESDITEQPAESVPGIGERLRTAREAQNLSVEQVAAELHLAESQIHALESEQFDTLGAPVFVRGHYRKYADLLKADTAALLQKLNEYYDAAEPDQTVIETEVARTLHREKRVNSVIITVTVIVLLAILVYLAFRYATTGANRVSSVEDVVETSDDSGGPGAAEPEFAAVNSGGQTLTLPAPTQQLVNEPEQIDERGPDARDATLGAVETTETAASVEPQALLPTVTITLIFNEDSWVEAVDADRRRLMFGIGRANTRRTLQGPAPVDVFFGYADGVEIEVDGEAFPLQNARRRGNTAQITIDGNSIPK